MNRDEVIRKIKYSASRRSTLELEQALARILDRLDIESLDDNELSGLADLFDMDDSVLQEALVSTKITPSDFDLTLWGKIISVM